MPTTAARQPGTTRPAARGPRRALTTTGAAIAGLSAVGLLAGCAADATEAVTTTTTTSETATSTATATATPTATTEAETEADSTYVDGTYSADGEYQSPNGTESVTVTVTVEDDIVTAVEVVGHATGGNSAQFQSQFASGIAAEVVGKLLDEVEVSRVAGSSLTSDGFNAAIDAIQAEAAA